ncbi:MAG: DUF1573 domain-containing protein [Phycisphaeraceae bacterium]|nr:DUF1573 domain-containing protein [Phycisphaeraceae bacterium]
MPEPEPDEDGMIDAPPPLEVDPPVLDFGFIAPRQQVTGKVKLWNRGRNPVRIIAVQPSCKCTTTNDVTDQDIAPGEFVELEAGLDAANSPQPRKAVIKILADKYQRVLEFDVRGEVAYPLRAQPGTFNIVRGQEQSGRVLIESIDKKPFRICNVHGEAPQYVNFDPTSGEPQSQYLIAWDLKKYGDAPPHYWLIETDHPDCPLLPVRIRHESTIPRPVFRMKDYAMNLGRMDPNSSVEAEILIEDPGEPILTVTSASDRARAEMIRTEVVDGWLHLRVRITPRKDLEGVFDFPLVIYSPTKDMEIPAFGVIRSSDAGCRAS